MCHVPRMPDCSLTLIHFVFMIIPLRFSMPALLPPWEKLHRQTNHDNLRRANQRNELANEGQLGASTF